MVRWTQNADKLLLCKILETHDLTLDFNKIVEAWREYPIPVSFILSMVLTIYLTAELFAAPCDEMPTPRAIRERIVKIKATASTAVLEEQAQTPGEAGPSAPKAKRGRKSKAKVVPPAPKSDPAADSVVTDSAPGSPGPTPSKKRKRNRTIKKKEEEPVVEKTPEPLKSESGGEK
ncbi:uncharacterized protein N7483_009773 [Penicillium malachiteum]|uniref:uncharacterized protein n=1 Tax=Penicillium malachiteum TaxID=1324776 RepID=UPI002548E7BA|nr:uncharacterized protein N7483_009773 [Penicillium malachiteum]KAJ5721839.1 hypothetical protein N7483_009773 [Penicillium malachiteum]